MKTSIFESKLFHKRSDPVVNEFEHKILLYLFDIDELDEIHKKSYLFGYNRKRPFSISDKNYLTSDKLSIKEKVFKIISGYEEKKEIKKIFLLTSPKYFKTVFNPVSFYFCNDEKEEPVLIIAEVNNTFGEKHVYILQPLKESNSYTAFNNKEFYVSPFNKVEGEYKFLFEFNGDDIKIQIDLMKNNSTFFSAALDCRKKDFSTRNILKNLITFNLIPLLTKPRIFKQAFNLFFIKKLEYNDKPLAKNKMTIRKEPWSLLQKFYVYIFLKKLKSFKNGSINILIPEKENIVAGDYSRPSKGTLYINDFTFFSKVINQRDIGFGESYMESFIEADDLNEVLKFFIINTSVNSVKYSLSLYIKHYIKKFRNLDNENSKTGSRKNIKRHYDLSNEFFSYFLDKDMNYSSGIYKDKESNLEKAQHEKIMNIIKKAEIDKNDDVLEIGCGWGSFSIFAAKHLNCNVTAVTISKEQYDYVSNKIKEENLEDRINLLLSDYRNIKGKFDKIVSIEMIEAVGHKYIKTFFKKIDSLLKEDGKAVIQGITIPDQEYFVYKYKYDWIKKYIFPGGHLFSLNQISKTITKNTGFIIHDLENIGFDYSLTLKDWHDNFIKNSDKIRSLGFDEIFMRKWIFYLKSCQALFESGAAGNLQIVLQRPYNEKKINV